MKSYMDWKKLAMDGYKYFFSKKHVKSAFLTIKHFNFNSNKVNKETIFLNLRRLGYSNTNNSNLPLETSKNLLRDKIDATVKWYEEVTGMDEVRLMQNRVIEAENKFVEAQENRRGATKSLNIIQDRLKYLHSELDSTTRGEERYLQLVTQEHVTLKEQKSCLARFQLCEKEERDCFSFLSAAVKDSHEKERAQAARTKYWSVIGSIIGTIIGVIGSSINNEFKMKELRKLVKVSVENQSENLSDMHEKLIDLANEVTFYAKMQKHSDLQTSAGRSDLQTDSSQSEHGKIEKLVIQQRNEIRIISTAVLTILVSMVLQYLRS